MWYLFFFIFYVFFLPLFSHHSNLHLIIAHQCLWILCSLLNEDHIYLSNNFYMRDFSLKHLLNVLFFIFSFSKTIESSIDLCNFFEEDFLFSVTIIVLSLYTWLTYKVVTCLMKQWILYKQWKIVTFVYYIPTIW